MSKLRQILRLHFQGTGAKSISKTTGIARNTVKKYLIHATIIKLSEQDYQKLTDQALDELFLVTPSEVANSRTHTLYEFFKTDARKLGKPGVTLKLLWDGYIQLHPTGYQQTAFYKYYRMWKRRTTPSMHMEHKSGDKVFVDFAGEKLKLVDPESGEIREVEVFVAILGASQLTYVEAVNSQKKEDFIMACENALQFFGGAPKAIVPDNLKSAVTRTHRYEPLLNENFAAFAVHYNMAVVPARAYRPKDKSLVEGAVKITYRRIYAQLSQEHYTSLEALNAEIWHHLDVHNKTPMQNRDYSRLQQFEDFEKASLQSLPALRFDLFKQASLTVMKNGFVQLTEDRHYYSVPYQYVGKKIKMMYTPSRVQIFYKYQLIAEHLRVRKVGSFSTVQEHLASQHRFLTEWNAESFIARAQEIHADVEVYIRQLLAGNLYPEHAYRGCMGILSFAKRVGKDRLALACRRAHQASSYSFRTIDTILKKGLENYAVEESTPTIPSHGNIRGQEYYK